MYYKNNFPEYLQAICIGPDPSFLANNTTNCEFASSFPQEVELMYDWKKLKRSSNPLNACRNFAKKLTIYGPDLDVQTIKFFVHKVNCFPAYYSDTVKQEVGNAFDVVKDIKIPENENPPIAFITNNTPVDQDTNFLNKLASMMKTCKKPCNYFKPSSSSLGTLADFGRALSDSANVLAGAASDALHAPVNIATGIFNKIKPAVRGEFLKLKVASEDLYRNGVKPFFSKKDRERVAQDLAQGKTPDSSFSRLPLTGDTSSYFVASQSHSEVQSLIKDALGDCFRMHDYGQRYNPYDPEMNTSYAKRKFMGVKNGEVSSLVDTLGSPAPAQYASETTYKNALDVPKEPEYKKYDDSPKAPKYNTYDGPSKGAEAVVTAGGGSTVNPVVATGSGTQTAAGAAAGAGLENVPTNGKVFEFDYNDVKLTAYGYANDECPDSGSEMGFGNAGNMIVPLKTVAVNPEALPYNAKHNPVGKGLVKPGDVLIITCTDRAGNTWVERRQVGDSSGAGLLVTKKHTYKFLIDEFQPNKKDFPSKLVDRSAQLKLKIQVADTKQPLPKWNVQEASQFAPMFLSRSDYERVKKFGKGTNAAIWQKVVAGEYLPYCKWSESEPLNPKIVNNKGC